MREAIRLCLHFLEHPAFAPLVARRLTPTDADLASDDALDVWMDQNVATNQHTSGTCKMGPSTDAMAVVDPTLRVHGLDGLRICDSSVMPSVIGSNTNAAVAMIAERAGDLILNSSTADTPE